MRAVVLLAVIVGGVLSAMFLPGCGPCRNSHDRIFADSAGWAAFGAPLSGEGMGMSLDILVSDPAGYHGTSVLVRDARVASVCAVDGCWMVVGADGRSVVVTSKDREFTFPPDCRGREVVIDGDFAVLTSSEAAAMWRELTESGCTGKAADTGTDGDVLVLVARGVRISD